jgi:hypothetical protein
MGPYEGIGRFPFGPLLGGGGFLLARFGGWKNPADAGKFGLSFGAAKRPHRTAGVTESPASRGGLFAS